MYVLIEFKLTRNHTFEAEEILRWIIVNRTANNQLGLSVRDRHS